MPKKEEVNCLHLRVRSGWFFAMVMIDQDKDEVFRTLTPLGYMKGWTQQQVEDFAEERGWEVYEI